MSSIEEAYAEQQQQQAGGRRRRGGAAAPGGLGEVDENDPPGNEGFGQEGGDDGVDGSGEGGGGGGGGGGGQGKGAGRSRRSSTGSARGGNRRLSLASLPGASATEATTRLLLPASRIGSVIGRGGDVIKGIRELTGARINISASPGSGNASAQDEERDSHFRLVSISGSVSSVCSAVELIARQAGLFDGVGGGAGAGGGRRGGRRDSSGGEGDEYHEGGAMGLRMVIDSTTAGQLIGKKGATINDIRSQSGARIQVLTEDDSLDQGAVEGERVVTVQGDEAHCRLAHQLICSVMASDPVPSAGGSGSGGGGGGGGGGRASTGGGGEEALSDATLRHHQTYGGGSGSSPHSSGGNESMAEDFDDSCEVIMRIPNDKIGRVIGKQGETINAIRQESQCRIDIENTRSGELAIRTVRIRGNMQQTQAAQQLITQKMQAAA